ncbi:MlaE family ABC transporter permease [Rhodococcus sp. EPR-157]|jgi:phospholipid/cholesterol/gamma-HCH transport system permease protein|uniref:MlaE family ABC transporter permease n=1 Tax=Rhodococcus sp. EPR-157 TaxID=1813677 RepID=UPI0009ED2FD7|nr:ABC transporter permease [Rhodococcus sp. EPR-157]
MLVLFACRIRGAVKGVSGLASSTGLTRVSSGFAGGLRAFGQTLELGAAALIHLVRDILSLRHPWRDTVEQAWFVVTVTVVPAVLVSIPFGIIVSVQVGSLTDQIGATSIAGAAGGLGVIRQGAPIVAALLLGGAAGAAVAADLGARTIREEIDAMRTMGIDPVRRLVVPRLAAFIVIAPLLCVLIIFMGLAAGYAINIGFQSGTPGSYISSFASFASVGDLIVALAKAEIFGIIVVVVACDRGLNAMHGPRGVANAVNAAVVLGVVSAFAVNVVITQLVAMFMPQRLG